jgi:hypothetical protein
MGNRSKSSAQEYTARSPALLDRRPRQREQRLDGRSWIRRPGASLTPDAPDAKVGRPNTRTPHLSFGAGLRVTCSVKGSLHIGVPRLYIPVRPVRAFLTHSGQSPNARRRLPGMAQWSLHRSIGYGSATRHLAPFRCYSTVTRTSAGRAPILIGVMRSSPTHKGD